MKKIYIFLGFITVLFVSLSIHQKNFLQFAPTEVSANEDILNEYIIGTYTTYFKDSSDERKNNIKLAAKKLNGTIVEPNAEFSFNKTVGPNTEADGYLPSKIFVEGEEQVGIGGGVCQVSSTLYNAVYYLNLDIVERNPHSKKVYYVPDDRDAATSYGGIDLKFINNREYPIYIRTMVSNEFIRIDILKSK